MIIDRESAEVLAVMRERNTYRDTCAELRAALDQLLRATVDAQLAEGCELSAEESAARARALAILEVTA